MTFFHRHVILALAAATLSSCLQEPSEHSASGAARRFVRAVERLEREPGAVDEVYALLSPSTQDALKTSAELATSLTGRSVRPADMVVTNRVMLAFSPRGHLAFRERVSGNAAHVTVLGDQPNEKASLHLVRVGHHWKVDVPIQQKSVRDGALTPKRNSP